MILWDQSETPPNRILANTLLGGVAGNTRTFGASLAGERVSAGMPGGPVAIALWKDDQSTSNQDVLRSTEYRSGRGWSRVVTVPGTRNVGDANISTLDDGRRVLVWSTNGELRFNLWSPGVGWQSSALVRSSARISVSTAPYLVAGANGTALVVWTEAVPGTGDYTLFGTWFDGIAWGPATPLSTQAGIIIGRDSVQVAADQQGSAIVVWQHTVGNPNDPLGALPQWCLGGAYRLEHGWIGPSLAGRCRRRHGRGKDRGQ